MLQRELVAKENYRPADVTKDTEESATQDGSGEDVATTFISPTSFLGNLSTLVKRAEIFAQW